MLCLDMMVLQPETEVIDTDLSCDVYSDQQLHELVAARDEYTWEFFRVLALCHTVVSVQSPDGTMISFFMLMLYHHSYLWWSFWTFLWISSQKLDRLWQNWQTDGVSKDWPVEFLAKWWHWKAGCFLGHHASLWQFLLPVSDFHQNCHKHMNQRVDGESHQSEIFTFSLRATPPSKKKELPRCTNDTLVWDMLRVSKWFFGVVLFWSY